MIDKISQMSDHDLASVIAACNNHTGLSLVIHPDYMEHWLECCVSEYEGRELTPPWHKLKFGNMPEIEKEEKEFPPTVFNIVKQLAIDTGAIRQLDFDDANYNGEKVALCLIVNDEAVCIMEDGIRGLYDLMDDEKASPVIRIYPVGRGSINKELSLPRNSK
jgi:hypothetical protein